MNETADQSADVHAGDSRADALAAVLLVAIAVATMVFWLSGQ